MSPDLGTATKSSSALRVRIQLAEWTRIVPGADGPGRDLAGLSLGNDARVQALTASLARAGVVTVTERRDGLEIETGSYVGRLHVGPLDLTIVPKIAWARWHTLFGYALRLRRLMRSNKVDNHVGPRSLHDLLVLELIAEARDLIGRGLHREYVRHRAALASPRGRIDFQRIAVEGGIRQAAVPCRFTRRSDDFALNRMLLSGLHAAASVATDPILRADVRRLAHEMEASVERFPLDDACLRGAKSALDRRTIRYEPALRLIELLHTSQSVSLDGDPDDQRVTLPGFALDMNRLWQRLLGRVLLEWDSGFETREEVALRGLIATDPAFNPRRRSVPTPRPDFALFRDGTLVGYLDAKYRDLWETALPREMLYQLALYAAAQGQGAAAMLYPTEAADAAEERLVIRDPSTGSTRAKVAMRPVSLTRLEALVAAVPSADRERARSGFAQYLCGGGG